MSSFDRTSPFRVQIFKTASLALLAFTLLVVVAGMALTQRGREEMSKSDTAFHAGELRRSIVHARQAALAYLPGAIHVKEAHLRLEAIARGAESENNLEIARLAWETLRLVHEQTHYWGRPASSAEERAKAGLSRLSRRPMP